MSVKIEPFIFGDEDSIQLNTQELPGASQKAPETEEKAKPDTAEDEDEDPKPFVDIDENSSEPFNFFGESTKEFAEKEKLSSDKVDYKAFSDFLVETEIWKDFDGRDDLEYNEESFQSLWKAQADNTAREFLNEERAQFGDTANQLIEYLKTGGTVRDFTANYTQQLEIASLDTSDEYGQEKAIKEYYKSLDWSDTKIKKHIDRVKDSGEDDFKEEAEDCQAKLISAIEEERETMVEEQKQISYDRKLRIENFNKAVRGEFHKDPNLADREKKELDKFVYDYKFQDNAGNKYSEFMVKMNDINQDPKKYAKFLKFVQNFDSFENKKDTAKEEKRKAFSFLKTGSNPLEGAQSAEMVKQKSHAPTAFKFR